MFCIAIWAGTSVNVWIITQLSSYSYPGLSCCFMVGFVTAELAESWWLVRCSNYQSLFSRTLLPVVAIPKYQKKIIFMFMSFFICYVSYVNERNVITKKKQVNEHCSLLFKTWCIVFPFLIPGENNLINILHYFLTWH